MEHSYSIGNPGQPWQDNDRLTWFGFQSAKRSYHDEVIAKLDALNNTFEVAEYGSLSLDRHRYPLVAVTVPSVGKARPWALITGGVHGYETSGVQGAIGFLNTLALEYREHWNLLVLPCVSPWGYETINRWNPSCLDPNRSFRPDSPSEEAAAVMALLDAHDAEFTVHMDLHETTDTDESEFRPALAARDGLAFEPGLIPDGFYTVGDTANPQAEFQASIIRGVSKVTHIAPADANGQLIGVEVSQPGVINYPFVELGLCAGTTDARFTTTTEVYPGSLSATPQVCIEAQIAAVKAGLDYAFSQYEV